MIFFKGLFNSKFKGVLTAPGAAVSCPRALPLDLARALPVIFAPSQFFRLMKSDTLNFQRLKKCNSFLPTKIYRCKNIKALYFYPAAIL